VDAILDQDNDLAMGLTISTYPSRFGFGFLEKSPENVKDIRKSLSDEILPRHLASIERTIEPNIGPWLGGQQNPTIADFALFYRFESFEAGSYVDVNMNLLKPYPNICAMMKAFHDLPSSAVDFSQ